MAKPTLSDEQSDFLQTCEAEFKSRYSDEDVVFFKYLNTERKKPPIVDPWYNKPRRPQFDWRQGRRHQHWDKGNDRYERSERHGGRYHMYQRNSRPY